MAFFTSIVRYLVGPLKPSSWVPEVICIVILTIASLPSGLVSINAFVIGSMKNSTGYFHPWASGPQVQSDISTIFISVYYGNLISKTTTKLCNF